MWGEAEPVQEPRVVSDARSETARVVLRAGKRLEVVVVERFVEPRQSRDTKLVQQLGMAPEARDTLGHGARGTPYDSGDLPVGGAVDDASGDREGKLRALQVVAHSEGLLGEAATTGPADEPGNDPAVAAPLVRRAKPAVSERRGVHFVLRAAGTRAEPRCEPIVRDNLDLGARPVHERAIRQAACPARKIEFTRFLAGADVR